MMTLMMIRTLVYRIIISIVNKARLVFQKDKNCACRAHYQMKLKTAALKTTKISTIIIIITTIKSIMKSKTSIKIKSQVHQTKTQIAIIIIITNQTVKKTQINGNGSRNNSRGNSISKNANIVSTTKTVTKTTSQLEFSQSGGDGTVVKKVKTVRRIRKENA